MYPYAITFKRILCRGPSVSVIVPIFNKADFLKQCLESIAEQTFKDLEVICVDDCSSDASPSIAREFAKVDGRFKYHRLKKHKGAGLARNRGIDLSLGEFLQFVDADDILPTNSTEALYELVSKKGAKIARGGVAVFVQNDVSKIVHSDVPPNAQSYRFADEPCMWNPWWHVTYLIQRKMLRQKKIRYPDLKDGEDPVFLSKVLTASDIISSTSKIVYYYRALDGNFRRTAIWDTIAHLEMVREIYIQYEPKCWFEGYGKFMIREEMPKRLINLNLEPDITEEINARLEDMLKPLC